MAAHHLIFILRSNDQQKKLQYEQKLSYYVFQLNEKELTQLYILIDLMNNTQTQSLKQNNTQKLILPPQLQASIDSHIIDFGIDCDSQELFKSCKNQNNQIDQKQNRLQQDYINPELLISTVFKANQLSSSKTMTRKSIMKSEGFEENDKYLPYFQYRAQDPLLFKAVKPQYIKPSIKIDVKSKQSLIKQKHQISLPSMVSLHADTSNHLNADIICVIDVSGSMAGQKIEMVKKTINYLLKILKPEDRICFVTFSDTAQLRCGLKCVDESNLKHLRDIVSRLRIQSGTNIFSGIELALQILSHRKQINKATSIFLLSDGQDEWTKQRLLWNIKQLAKRKNVGPVSVNSFGYGNRHDQDLMSAISELYGGIFYFVQEFDMLGQAFSNALGNVVSVVAHDVRVRVSLINEGLATNIKIEKVYGKVWRKLDDRDFQIYLPHLSSELTKDFVFELEIPHIDIQVNDDSDRNIEVLSVTFLAKGINEEVIEGECKLNLTILNDSEELIQSVENQQVVQNYLRVLTAEKIKQSMRKADKNKFQQSITIINDMIRAVQANKRARKEKLDELISDLERIRKKCEKANWQIEGRKISTSYMYSMNYQTGLNYTNSIQKSITGEMQKLRLPATVL